MGMMNGYTVEGLEGNYKKVGERNMLDDLHDLAIARGYNKETTRVQYERKENEAVYSIITKR